MAILLDRTADALAAIAHPFKLRLLASSSVGTSVDMRLRR